MSRMIKLTRNRIRKIPNSTRAIPTAVPAIPVNPSNPAISAMIKNVNVNPSMLLP